MISDSLQHSKNATGPIWARRGAAASSSTIDATPGATSSAAVAWRRGWPRAQPRLRAQPRWRACAICWTAPVDINSDARPVVALLPEISDELMESKGGKQKKSSNSSGSSLHFEAPLGHSIEDVRPHGEIKKAAYSNCCRKPP